MTSFGMLARLVCRLRGHRWHFWEGGHVYAGEPWKGERLSDGTPWVAGFDECARCGERRF